MYALRLHAAVEGLAVVEPIGDLMLKGLRQAVPAWNVVAVKQGCNK